MLRFLADLSISYGPLRVFDSITFRAALAMLIAFIICLKLIPKFISHMKTSNVTENMIKDSREIAELHSKKADTPTMGGMVMLIGVTISSLLLLDIRNPLVTMGLFIFILYGLLGFVDDFMKYKRLGDNGLTKKQKLVGQILIAGVVCFGLSAYGGEDTTKILLPFTKWGGFQLDLGFLYYPFFILVVIGCSNAVNLTDGLDGLAGGCSIFASIAYAVFAYIAGNSIMAGHFRIPYIAGSGELCILMAALIGGVAGFLWFNAKPAQLFMGDTGSLALGGLIGYTALISKHAVILPIIGGIFVIEAGSVLLQVASFKLRGKRLFKCAPYHHHLELSGWNENHIVVRLWMVGAILAVIGLGTLKMH